MIMIIKWRGIRAQGIASERASVGRVSVRSITRIYYAWDPRGTAESRLAD